MDADPEADEYCMLDAEPTVQMMPVSVVSERRQSISLSHNSPYTTTCCYSLANGSCIPLPIVLAKRLGLVLPELPHLHNENSQCTCLLHWTQPRNTN